MTNSTFEAQLKSKLEGMELPYEADTWALLQAKLEGLQASPEAPSGLPPQTEQRMAGALRHMEVPYEPAHWHMMAKALDQAARNRRRLWLGKLAEAAVFLLLLVSLGQMTNGSTGRGGKKTAPAASATQAAAPENSPASGQSRRNAPAQRHAGHQTATLPGSTAAIASAAPGSWGSQAAALLGTALGTQLLAAIADAANPLQNIDNQQIENPNSASAPAKQWAMFQQLPGPGVNLLDPRQASLQLPKVPIKIHRKKPLYAGAYAAMQQGRVQDADGRRQASGQGMGLLVGYRSGKWGFETGIAYQNTRFAPKKRVEIYAGNLNDGYLGSYAAEVDADQLTVPLHVTRRIARIGKTSVHAVAGTTAQLTLQKANTYKTLRFNSGPSAQPPASGQNAPQLRQQGRGLLEQGGALQDNFSATADLALRIELPLGRSRFAAFLEPTAQWGLGPSGIGIKPNQINALALRAGVVATL
jgi:hypothetical protein